VCVEVYRPLIDTFIREKGAGLWEDFGWVLIFNILLHTENFCLTHTHTQQTLRA